MAKDNQTASENKSGKKLLKVVIAITTVMLLLFVALMIYYFGASYKEFDSISRKEFAIPGLNTNFTPQGMAYDSSAKKFIISGYIDGKPSKLYVVNKKDGEIEHEFTLTFENKEIKEHFGGVAVYNSALYIAGDGEVYCLPLDSVYNPIVEGSVEATGKFIVPNNTAFLTVYNGHLIVGEFYHSKKYETDPSHHIKINENETNRALALAYKMDDTAYNGVTSISPKYAISLCNDVQGMCLTDGGEIILSTSYSLPDSKLKTYPNILSKSSSENIDVEGKSIPLYVLDSSKITRVITAPCMSEEIALVDKRVYILFENNCSKYRLFTRTRYSNVYSIEV